MDIRALHNRSVITTDDRLLIPANDINWRGYTGTVHQHVRACVHACVWRSPQAGLGCRGNPAPGVSGGERSFVCSVCDHLRVSAEHTLVFLPGSFLSIRLDQSGTTAPNRHTKHMLTSLLINAPIHTEPRLTWCTFPRPWMPTGTGLNWLRSVLVQNVFEERGQRDLKRRGERPRCVPESQLQPSAAVAPLVKPAILAAMGTIPHRQLTSAWMVSTLKPPHLVREM